MSLISVQKGRLEPIAIKPLSDSALFSLPGLVLIGLFLSMILSMSVIRQFLTTGFFLDPDDAMRMAQVHDFMDGQAWYDLTAKRLDPPNGVFMHWTRVIDLPMAMIVRFFELFTDRETSDRIMRLLFPMAMLAGLYFLSARIAGLLVGSPGPLLAVLVTSFGGAVYGYFAPGRLDHDHVAILGLVAMLGTLLRALDASQTREAALLGLVIAFNLSVSLETLPFVVIGIAALPAAWIFRGREMQANLQAFALALIASLLLAFVLTVAPQRYLNGACDTFSAAHMVAGLVGGGLCLALAVLNTRLSTWQMRLAAALVAGLATIASVALTYPACLGDPYANLDPVMRQYWLDSVSEARPLFKAIGLHPGLILLLVVPVLVGLAGTVWAALSEHGLARNRWIAITAIVLAGCAASIWQVRATGVVAPFSLFGIVYIVARLTRKLTAKESVWQVPAMAGLSLVVSPLFLGLFMPDTALPNEAENAKIEMACSSQAAFTAIAALPKGIILSPISSGAHLLARTPHGVIAAPFHRNEHGNRLALDAFLANPEAAQAIVRRSRADYIVYCPVIGEIEIYRDAAPDGLGAQLDAGNVPTWLEPMNVDSAYKVLKVR